MIGWPRQAPPSVLPEGFFEAALQSPCATCGSWTFRRGPLAGACAVCLRFSRVTAHDVGEYGDIWAQVIPEDWIQRLPFDCLGDAALSSRACAAQSLAPPCSPGEIHMISCAPSCLVGEFLLAWQWMVDANTPSWAAPAAGLCQYRAAATLAALCGARFPYALELTRLIREQALCNPEVAAWLPRVLTSTLGTIPDYGSPGDHGVNDAEHEELGGMARLARFGLTDEHVDWVARVAGFGRQQAERSDDPLYAARHQPDAGMTNNEHEIVVRGVISLIVAAEHDNFLELTNIQTWSPLGRALMRMIVGRLRTVDSAVCPRALVSAKTQQSRLESVGSTSKPTANQATAAPPKDSPTLKQRGLPGQPTQGEASRNRNTTGRRHGPPTGACAGPR